MERKTIKNKRNNRCRSRNTFITTSIIFSLLFIFSVNAWWNETYSFRYPIYNNYTETQYPLCFNKTGTDLICALIMNESYIYCENLGCDSGLVAIANETDQKFWGNETNHTGNSPMEVWDNGYNVVYHMNNITGWDSTKNYNSGASSGVPVVNDSGLFGKSIYFNGSSSILNTNMGIYIVDDGDFTIEEWIRPSIDFTGTTQRYLVDIGNIFIAYGINTGKLEFIVNDQYASYTTTLSANQWYYIVGRVNSSDVASLWVNGVEVGSTGLDTWTRYGGRGRIGASWAGSNFMVGDIDEFRISNVSRSDDYIRTQYYSGLGNMTTIDAEEIGGSPQWQDISESVSDPSNYLSSQNYGFQVNFTDNVAMDTVLFLHNATGSWSNGTCVNITDIYYFNYTGLPAGLINYTFYGNDTINIVNTTDYNTFTVNKVSSELILTSSPSWTIAEGTQINVTCSGNGGVLLKDGGVVADEYISILGYGTYNFTCYIPVTGNYTGSTVQNTLTVGSSSYGCTNTDIYAFSKTITASGTSMNLNFTNLINLNYVNENLTDVWVNSSVVPDAWINQTDMGNILVVNTTGVTTFDVRFGNYIGNQNYTDTPINFTSDNVSITGYTEINPYYVLTFYEESNNTNQLPPTDNITMTLYCSDGTSDIDVNHDKILVSTVNQLDEMRVKVSYDDTFYYRNLLVSSAVEFRKFFLVDFTENDLVKMIMTLEDYTGDYGEGELKIKKTIKDTLETITELNFDAENKAIIYLIDGNKYNVEVHSTEIDASRSIGYLYVDADDTTKTIIIGYLTTVESLGSGNVYLNLSIGSVDLVWNDTSNTTSLVELWVYNYTEGNDTLLYHDSCSNSSFCSFTYDTPENATYRVKYEITQTDYPTWGATIILSGEGVRIIPSGFPIGTLISELGGDTLAWIPLLLILPIPLLFGRNSAGIGCIVMFLAVLLLDYWGIFTVPAIIKAVAGFISVIVFITRIKRDVV